MIIIGVDNVSKNIAYTFDDNASKKLTRDLAYNCIRSLPQLSNGVFIKDHLVIIKKDVITNYYFFFNDVKNQKDAKHQAKVLLAGIKELVVISESNQKLVKSVNDIVWHNTKNLVNSMTHTMQRITDYEHLRSQEDKVAFIERRLIELTKQEAHDILACSRQLELLSVEYNVIDNFQPGFSLNDNQKNWNKLHSILVQANYIYEQQAYDSNVHIKIQNTHKEVLCDFFTIKSAFSYIFENCVKYCMENSEVDVECVAQKNGSIKVDISMKSVMNSKEEEACLFHEKMRGTEAEKKSNGSGIGMFVAKKFFELNGFSILFRRMNEWQVEKNGIVYSNNIFVIDIPSEYVRGS